MPDQALLAIPAYFAAVFYPHAYSHYVIRTSSNPKAYNNAMPRNAPATAEKTLKPAELARYQRARMAHNNGLEGLTLFATGILAAKYAGIDVDTSAWTLVGLRVLYTLLFIYTSSVPKSFLRTLVWGLMVGLNIRLFLQAAYASG